MLGRGHAALQKNPRTRGTPIRPERAPLILVRTVARIRRTKGGGQSGNPCNVVRETSEGKMVVVCERRMSTKRILNKSDCKGEAWGLGWPEFRGWFMKVSELIGSRKDVYSVSEDTSVMEAAKYLREKQVRSVGVVDASGKLIGVVSQSDVSDKVAAENRCPAWMKVSEIMTRELIAVTPEMTFDDCLVAMERGGVYHLVILDEEKRYRGMLSVSDLLKVLSADHKGRADLLESYIFPAR
jgi:CBS domain-containing protein